MYKTVYDINKDELKMAYYDQLQYTDDADTFLCYDAIPDDVIFEQYDGICFVDDDFWCNVGEETA